MKRTNNIDFIFILLLIPIGGFSQDKIFFLSGEKVEATAIELDSGMVKYKNFHNPDGPIYIARKKDIAVIEYANGEYLTLKRKGKLGFAYDTIFTNTNIFSFNLISPIAASIGVSYEKIIFNGNWGIRFPVVFGNHAPVIAGMGFSYYPQGQEKYSLYLSVDYFYGISESFSGVTLNTGFRANWSQKIALALELGGDVLLEKLEITGVLFPGIHTPALNLSYRF